MERTAMERIADRLSTIDGLYFPGGMLGPPPPPPSGRKAALFDLLSRDAPIFLQRYGPNLTATELGSFDPLRSDYEVRWHLDHLRPSPADSPARAAATARNRRRACMERMVRAGEYFSEEAMREREPYLHHQYVGRFQDRAGRVLARPGERWSETLMRRCQEAVLAEKIRGEQERLGVDRKDWLGGEEEEEEEESEEEGDEVNVVSRSLEVE